jgi:hypothetical protein
MIPFERSRPEGCLSDLHLDRLVAGELAPPEEQAARVHLGGCAGCAARLAAIEAERAAFQAAPPPLRLTAVRQSRPAPATPAGRLRRARAFAPALTAALAAAAAVALVFIARPPSEPPRDERTAGLPLEDPGTRSKGGGSRIGFYVARGDAVALGAPGEVVHANDRLQFTYSSADPAYFALLSIDGARKASIYFPAGAVAAPIQPGEGVPLPSSVVLDATLGSETIYGLFCDAPVELEPLRAALESAPERAPAPAGCRVDRVQIVKRTPP